MLKVTQQDTRGAAAQVSFPHGTGFPTNGSSASLKELIQFLENYRLQTSPPLPRLPKNGSGAWGLCAVTSSGNQRLTRWPRPGKECWRQDAATTGGRKVA